MIDFAVSILGIFKYLFITLPVIALFLVLAQFNWTYILEVVSILGMAAISVLAVIIFFGFVSILD